MLDRAYAASVNDPLDIHGGRGICDGPSNYIQGAYLMVPVGITVEGANILTRTLITFAQGALRSHPYLFTEIEAPRTRSERAVPSFDRAFDGHVCLHAVEYRGQLFHNAVSFGAFASTPPNPGATRRWWRRPLRALHAPSRCRRCDRGLLGGGLKVKQKITGRMADALAELYLLSSILKR